METTQTHPPRSLHWRSLFQLGWSGLAVLLLWGMAVYMFAGGAFQFSEGVSLGQIDPSAFLIATALAWIGLLILPSAWFAILQLMNRFARVPYWMTWKNAGVLIWGMVLIVPIGYAVALTPAIAWLILPPLNVLAVSIPAVWYLSLGGRGLQSSSPQSTWGVFSLGLTLGTGLILFVELIGGVVAAVALIVWLSPLPGFTEEIQRLLRILQTSVEIDPTLFLPFAEKYLMRRSVLVSGLLYVAGFAPLLEEFLKPIGLWFMNKQTLTPARGFLAGMLSGAAFGLFESLLQAVPGEEWALLAVARTGTSLIHIFNSGLVGWGFALAWQTRSPMPWLKRFLVAVIIHGLWNGSTVMTAVAALPDQDLVSPFWGPVGIGVLLFLGAGCFVALIVINQQLQREALQVRVSTETLAQDHAPARGAEADLDTSPPSEPGEVLLAEETPPEDVIPDEASDPFGA